MYEEMEVLGREIGTVFSVKPTTASYIYLCVSSLPPRRKVEPERKDKKYRHSPADTHAYVEMQRPTNNLLGAIRT